MDFKNESYSLAKESLKEFYRAVKRMWCPALSDHIIFDKNGLRHLIGKGKIIRPKSEQKRRFRLFRFVPEILSDPNADYVCEIKHIDEKPVRYWVFNKLVDGLLIRVVIKQTPNGKKRFLSVYEKKQKSPQ